MRIFYLFASLALASFAMPTSAAKWELAIENPTTRTVYVSQNGRVYAADYRDDFTGGLIYSDDNGDTWDFIEVDDAQYAQIFETPDGDVFATGAGCKVARGLDKGEQWTLLDYSEVLKPYLSKPGEEQYCQCYGGAYLNGRVYLADFSYGVIYSEDMGETWNMTDRESLIVTFDDGWGASQDAIYNLAAYDGKLYAFGLYRVYIYDEKNDKWEVERNDSNCMATNTVFNNLLVCGRAIENFDVNTPFLVYTNGKTWENTGRPSWTGDNYVRGLASDDTRIYAALLVNGILFSEDMGQTWTDISEGLPKSPLGEYETVIQLACDDKYLYSAVYSPNMTSETSGVWRLDKSLISGISDVDAPGNVEIRISGDIVAISGDYNRAIICDMTGVKVMESYGGDINIGELSSNIYLIKVENSNGAIVKKFVRQ